MASLPPAANKPKEVKLSAPPKTVPAQPMSQSAAINKAQPAKSGLFSCLGIKKDDSRPGKGNPIECRHRKNT